MKRLTRFCASTAWALIMGATCFAQHYTQTNLGFQHSGSCAGHRSSTDKPVGSVPSLGQPMVGL